MKKYTVDYFIKKFKRIPSSKWTIIDYQRGKRFCALGHCGCTDDMDCEAYFPREAKGLCKIFDEINLDVAKVNDGEMLKYPQKNARARILAALQDIKDGVTRA